jgi:5-methylcytosine-specific restriction endonuclease McrA
VRRTKTDKQRAEHYGVEYEPINRKKVFERDDWTCHICGESTSKSYDHADPWSPTLDHIIPISQGGPHLYENVALAHSYCNAVKCDGRSGEDAATMLGVDSALQVA